MKYIKNPVVVEATQYNSMKKGLEDGFDTVIVGTVSDTKELEAIHSFYGNPSALETVQLPYIRTYEGKVYLSKGDYIITNVQGVQYTCNAGIFEATYTPHHALNERLHAKL